MKNTTPTTGQIILMAIKALDTAAQGEPINPQAAQVVADGLRLTLARIQARREYTAQLQALPPEFRAQLQVIADRAHRAIAKQVAR